MDAINKKTTEKSPAAVFKETLAVVKAFTDATKEHQGPATRAQTAGTDAASMLKDFVIPLVKHLQPPAVPPPAPAPAPNPDNAFVMKETFSLLGAAIDATRRPLH
jgi:hypothetical protein